MNPITKALALVLALTSQAAVLIALSFWLNDYLDVHYPLAFAWAYIIVPLVLLSIGHSFYLGLRYLMKIDAVMRGQGPKKR